MWIINSHNNVHSFLQEYLWTTDRQAGRVLTWHDQTCRTVTVISIAAAKEEQTTGIARRGVIVYNYTFEVTSLDQKFPANGL